VKNRTRFRGALVLFFAWGGAAGRLAADNVAVRHPEGLVRGFLVLREPGGPVIANGDLIQSSRGERVTTRLVFHFRDGSLQDETAVYTEHGRFELVSDHLVQRGPAFPRSMDVSIDRASGRVVVRHREGGEEKSIDERMELPADLANGMTLALLKNIDPGVATTWSMLVATPKPRLVKLHVTRAGVEPFSVGRAEYKATRFKLEIEIGGIAGLIAPLVGKKPKDASVWIIGGDAPGFVRSENQFYEGGPIWRIELASPSYPK
jgi:hypothetical protein